jgi:hypothetical protein
MVQVRVAKNYRRFLNIYMWLFRFSLIWAKSFLWMIITLVITQNCQKTKKQKKQGVCVTHYGLAIYTKKYLLKAKRRIMKIQIFHHAKI